MKERSPQMQPDPQPAGSRGGTSPRGYVVLACEMIEDEVNSAYRTVHGQAPGAPGLPPVVWIESGLHEVPRRLRDHLQHLIDLLDEGAQAGSNAIVPSVSPGRGAAQDRAQDVEVAPVEQVLLALGYCGNGLEGLVSSATTLVFPRVDDCISLFLNHGCVRENIERDARAFYLTGGWLSHDNPVQDSYDCFKERFGPKRAAELTRASMAAYERITLIDTGAYDVDHFSPQSQSFAADLALEHTTVSGSIQLLERLFGGPWDSEIVVLPPGEPISIWHLFDAKVNPPA